MTRAGFAMPLRVASSGWSMVTVMARSNPGREAPVPGETAVGHQPLEPRRGQFPGRLLFRDPGSMLRPQGRGFRAVTGVLGMRAPIEHAEGPAGRQQAP